jgi:hypothetical protein
LKEHFIYVTCKLENDLKQFIEEISTYEPAERLRDNKEMSHIREKTARLQFVSE